jgi:UDP-N-acetylglucosamine 2-epimerase (non-hydrolysing)
MIPFGFDDRRLSVVLGTRPEIIKLGPLVKLLGMSAEVIHTGQHYDGNLSGSFLTEMGLGTPSVSLGIGGRTRGEQIGLAVAALSQRFAVERPDAVIVHGDTNATVAGALAANACGVPLVHLEAGLRSFDRAMPEEHNRVVADHLADLCLAATEVNRANLAAEGIGSDKVMMIGNTVVDAVLDLLPSASERAEILAAAGLEPNGYAVATFHRPENVDDGAALSVIINQLAAAPLPVVLPLHPRTAAAAARAGIDLDRGSIRCVEPQGYRHFLALCAEATVLVSDSGGVQEESSVVKRPVVVVRNSTERPEILGTFAQLVRPGPSIGVAIRAIAADAPALHQRLAQLPSPYGDGTSARRAVAAIHALLDT